MYKKVLAYLALTLGIAEVGVVLVSWLLTAAMPESFTHSLTSPEGIRWFTGHFVDHLTSSWLVWLVLISITIGVVKQSRVLHFDHTQYRIMSESIKGISQVYDAMNQGIRLLSPCFLFYILVMQLYTSVLYVMG